MKKLSNEQMIYIEGGSFLSGFCGGVDTIGTVVVLAGATGGVGVAFLGGMAIGCGLYDLFS